MISIQNGGRTFFRVHAGQLFDKPGSKNSVSEKIWQQHVVEGPRYLTRKKEKGKSGTIPTESGTSRKQKTERCAGTLHHYNKSSILAQDGTDPGSVVHMKPASEDRRKLKVRFVSRILKNLSFSQKKREFALRKIILSLYEIRIISYRAIEK